MTCRLTHRGLQPLVGQNLKPATKLREKSAAQISLKKKNPRQIIGGDFCSLK
jgi:hypothetical protein